MTKAAREKRVPEPDIEVVKLNGLGMESNAYLVLCDRPMLVDVGTGARLERTLAEMKELLGKRKLHRLVLTHMHFDHTGGAAAMQEETGAEALALPPDSWALAEGDGKLTCSGWLGEEQRPLKLRALKEGEKLDCGPLSLEVLHTPGHTEGSLCLFDSASGTLFSGDTVFADGGVGRWDLPTGNHGRLVESLKRLSKLGVKALYPGHGPYYEEGGSEHIRMGLEMASNISEL
jgi:glyoxylase-like metal-dependent hydrolase (beta-lactamase superfamily II)